MWLKTWRDAGAQKIWRITIHFTGSGSEWQVPASIQDIVVSPRSHLNIVNIPSFSKGSHLPLLWSPFLLLRRPLALFGNDRPSLTKKVSSSLRASRSRRRKHRLVCVCIGSFKIRVYVIRYVYFYSFIFFNFFGHLGEFGSIAPIKQGG